MGIIRIALFFGFVVPSWCAAKVQRVESYFSLPPAMQALYGHAVVHEKPRGEFSENRCFQIRGAGRYIPKLGIIPARHRAHIIVKGEGSRQSLASFLLTDFYDRVLSLESRSRHEKRLRLAEFLPVTEERFVEWGSRCLLRGRSGISWFDAWWTIRMGLAETRDDSHHLIVICLKYDFDGKKDSLGHFCFALRKRGGDAQRDVVFDFRAPWYRNRPPTLMEGMNSGNKLDPLRGFTENLYDWLHTQTSYRHCLVQMWFLPVSREEITVLRYFEGNREGHDAGDFKGLRKNCASLGMAFWDRLKPISEPISLGRGIADIPSATAARIVAENGGDVPFFQLENDTHERGREPTSQSKIYRAQPSRARSRSFRELGEVAELN